MPLWPMHDPPHPGEIIRDACLEPLGLSVIRRREVAWRLAAFSFRIAQWTRSVSAEMAIRLEKAGWSVAESWLRNQMSHDLWQARQRADQIKVEKYPSVETAA